MIFSERTTAIYDLPLPKGTVILRPESAIVRFSSGKSSDFGALCYLRREPAPVHFSHARRQSKGRLVDLSSFTVERANRVLALIFHISDDLKHSGRRTETVRDSATRFVDFMFWADTNGHHDVLNSAEAARPVVQAYAKYLRERVMINAISINSAARQQNTVFSLLGRFLEVDNLTRGINLLRKNPATTEVTVPPNEDSQGRVLGLCESLFAGLTSFVLDAKPYPYALTVPQYLNYPGNILWIFPTTSWFMSPQMLLDRKCRSGFNYSEGRLFTLQELQAIRGTALSVNAGKSIIRKAKLQLQMANSDLQHGQRLHIGMIALNAFILLFLAQTGMNWAQVVSLTWKDNYDVSTTHQSFRTIKWRAGNMEVAFELPVAFMPNFKRYLELRKYLLCGQPCDWLFFKKGGNGIENPVEIKNAGANNIYQTLRRIDPHLPAVTSRQWRAAKSDWLIRNTDPSTAALVLQNSEKTVLASYAAGSETSHLDELSSFLDSVSETVVNKGQIIEGGISRAVGYCSSYGTPHKITEQTLVQPDCRGPEGCLFCDKFKVHADEIDTRKLVSCRYCLRVVEPLAGNNERTNILAPIFNRIEDILAEVSRRDKALALRVTKEVEEDGELDPYWARKLEMLMELGLVV